MPQLNAENSHTGDCRDRLRSHRRDGAGLRVHILPARFWERWSCSTFPGPIHVCLLQHPEQLMRVGYAEHWDSHPAGGILRVQRNSRPEERQQQFSHRSGQLRGLLR